MFITVWVLCLITLSVVLFLPQQHIYKNIKYAVITKDVVNVREFNNIKSNVVLKAYQGQQFKILNDTSDTDWLTIECAEKTGYVYKSLTKQIEKPETVGVLTRFDKNPIIAFVSYPLYLLLLIFLSIKLFRVDRKRKSVEIYYELDEDMNNIYNSFIESFNKANEIKKVWQVYSKSSGHDSKYHGGASTLINRQQIKEISGHSLPMRFFTTNAAIPYIGLQNIKLFFLPERLLIKKERKYAAVMYKNLSFDSVDSRFVEDDSVPSDAKVVDHTWRYVNKSGGPDKRFNNNKKIPVCLYTDYHLRTENGINEIIMTSKVGGLDDFENAICRIKGMQDLSPDIEFGKEKYNPDNELTSLIDLLHEKDYIKPTDIQLKLSCGFSHSNKILGLLLQLEAIVPDKNNNYKVMKEKIKLVETDISKHFG